MEIAKEAVIADNNNEHEKALSLYKQALTYFMTGLKYIKNDRTKQAVREKIVQYMDRAEQLKEATSAPKSLVCISTIVIVVRYH